MVGLWLVYFMENPKNGGKLHISICNIICLCVCVYVYMRGNDFETKCPHQTKNGGGGRDGEERRKMMR